MPGLKRRFSTLLAATCIAGATAHGSIGETEAQIEKSYGHAITILPARAREAGLTKCYATHGLLIAVTYLRGQSVREVLAKSDSSQMSEEEIRDLLARNSGAKAGESERLAGPKTVTAGVREWRSADQASRVAIYDSHTSALFITTQKFINLTNARKQPGVRLRPADLVPLDRPQRAINLLDKTTAKTLRRSQPQPSASPSK